MLCIKFAKASHSTNTCLVHSLAMVVLLANVKWLLCIKCANRTNISSMTLRLVSLTTDCLNISFFLTSMLHSHLNS